MAYRADASIAFGSVRDLPGRSSGSKDERDVVLCFALSLLDPSRLDLVGGFRPQGGRFARCDGMGSPCLIRLLRLYLRSRLLRLASFSRRSSRGKEASILSSRLFEIPHLPRG